MIDYNKQQAAEQAEGCRTLRLFSVTLKPLMNMVMNRNILTFLNEYAEIPDPQYAIMLRGAWGCAKRFSSANGWSN